MIVNVMSEGQLTDYCYVRGTADYDDYVSGS